MAANHQLLVSDVAAGEMLKLCNIRPPHPFVLCRFVDENVATILTPNTALVATRIRARIALNYVPNGQSQLHSVSLKIWLLGSSAPLRNH